MLGFVDADRIGFDDGSGGRVGAKNNGDGVGAPAGVGGPAMD